GKTRVLTHRVAYLIEEKGVNPWNILAITFTNKAARETRERVNNLMGEGAEDIWVSTFHALCVRILRRDAEKIGFNRSFTIASTSEQRTLMKQVLNDLNIDTIKYDPRAILSVISIAKNDLLDPKYYSQQAIQRFKDIVIKLYFVGDADQSMYGWRGANMKNIMNFEEDYPDATVIKLEQNYRSTKNILAAANNVIENNVNRKDKTLWTDNKQGDKIHYYRANN